MITIPLRILLVEDVETDVLLTNRHLKKIIENPDIRVVSNLDDCKTELINFVPDVVISDYNLPTCNGLEVLELSQAIDSSIPFIFLTGAIEDEEMAANTILSGATGFVLKKNMDNLDKKLSPILKKIVFNMDSREELRDKIRRNKIAVNQIHTYLDNIKMDNEEQKQNIDKIRSNMDDLKFDDDAK
jgi:response regulator RpfG family c-di-GMP phosphodiesterase